MKTRIQLQHFHNTTTHVPMFMTRLLCLEVEGTMMELQMLRLLTMARVCVSIFVSLKLWDINMGDLRTKKTKNIF